MHLAEYGGRMHLAENKSASALYFRLLRPLGGLGGHPPIYKRKKLKYKLIGNYKMYFNTTTIPTHYDYNSFLSIFYILSSGIVIGASIIELFLHRIKDTSQMCLYDSSEEDEQEEEESYCDKYKEEFSALTHHKLSDEKLVELNKKIVREQVAEKVEVIMTYDKTTETFWYYTDQLKEVSYPILEAVARKFAIENDCKSICLQAEYGVEGAGPLGVEGAEPLAEQQGKLEVQIQEHIPSVFAKFKAYNAGKGSVPNFTSVVKVIEQMNHFRYRGKIIDYEERSKEKVEEPKLDYASYKKFIEEKKEN
jgi:hypothetical protein